MGPKDETGSRRPGDLSLALPHPKKSKLDPAVEASRRLKQRFRRQISRGRHVPSVNLSGKPLEEVQADVETLAGVMEGLQELVKNEVEPIKVTNWLQAGSGAFIESLITHSHCSTAGTT